MPRTEDDNQQIRTQQRARILDAARRVFARKGLAATVDDVAAEAGISHGLAYRYFTNKTALFSELIAEDLNTPTGWLEDFADVQIAPMEKIRQMVTGLAESRRNYPERYQLLARALNDVSAPVELHELVAQRGKRIRDVLRRLIVAGQTSGEVASGDPNQLVRAIFSALDGLTARSDAGTAADLLDFPDAEIFLRMLKP